MHTRIKDYFTHLSTIPRESWNEAQVRERLIQWSMERGYRYAIDTIWNLIIQVPATPWYESVATTILQAHMDMVCVSAPWVNHDFLTDPIKWSISDGWMKAQWTTLWADNGIGLCMILAVCDENHGALELYFTVDEEVGLTWALHTQPELFSWTRLINLDTEDLWEITISSAWGSRMDIVLPIVKISPTLTQYSIELTGLIWGHSGAEIHHPRWNAHRLLQELLLTYDGNLELVSLHGWSADNAIPASSQAIVGIDNKEKFEEHTTVFVSKYRDSLDHHDLTVAIKQLAKQEQPVIAYWKEFIHRLFTLPNGVQSISEKIEWLTQTSLSRWILRTHEDSIHYSWALRSSIMDELDALIEQCQTHIGSLGEATIRWKYPWRQQDPESELVKLTRNLYKQVYDGDIHVLAVHAWLECWAIVWAFDRPIDAVSFGPTIQDPHSPDERCEVKSIDITYEVLKGLVVS
jgi:dipeptidase D